MGSLFMSPYQQGKGTRYAMTAHGLHDISVCAILGFFMLFPCWHGEIKMSVLLLFYVVNRVVAGGIR